MWARGGGWHCYKKELVDVASETLEVREGGDSRTQSATRGLAPQQSRAGPGPHQASGLGKYFCVTRTNYLSRVIGKDLNKHLEIASLTSESPSASLKKLFLKNLFLSFKKLFVPHPH